MRPRASVSEFPVSPAEERGESVPATGQEGTSRPRVEGKFISLNGQKLYIRGVTYGTFRPDEQGNLYPSAETVDRDFAAMAESGLNAVRVYTLPPRWLLDLACRHGLLVMVGHAWEQHIAFLDEAKRRRQIEARLREGVRACAGHPAVLCHVIGNEIPASIVRWYGPRRIERFLERLYRAAKSEDPGALVTYVNYPTTEYLELPFLDLVCFNVYLESEERLRAYLARLQNVAGPRPLLLTELGLDSGTHGEDGQARAIQWQVHTTFASGCGGVFVFAWTDDWYCGGRDIQEWHFGLTRRDRSPKPALAAARRALAELPFPRAARWPRISVVVCSYNGSRTIRQALEAALSVDYPNFEVIVVNDGSTDATPRIAADYPVRVITTENRGLSSARNTGLAAATGEIVAYLDDDAYPDPHWLTYLAASFMNSGHVGIGGPNLPPPGSGDIAECVANAPGGPTHVLLSDSAAEHIPGCNCAFRKSALEAAGGFDPRFRVAGDDVDLCWRLQQNGGTLGFSPAAFVWHHRRNSIRAYLKQQVGYGKAEALLERKWPAKYNALGHYSWRGRIYEPAGMLASWRRRIYHGTWGAAPFQLLYQPAAGFSSLPAMPEWHLVNALLAALCAGCIFWRPLLLALPLLALSLGAPLAPTVRSVLQARFSGQRTRWSRLKLQALTLLLHLLQPLARLRGRISSGLTPWRSPGAGRAVPIARRHTLWSEQWQPATAWLTKLESLLQAGRARTLRGGDFDRWDLQAGCGLLGAAQLRMAVEEHGLGRQLLRFRSWPRWSRSGAGLSALFATLAAIAAHDNAWLVAVAFAMAAVLLLARMVGDCARATAAIARAIEKLHPGGRA